MVSMVIWQVILMIFDAPQTIRLFPIEPNVIGPNRGENEFNLTLLLAFIILQESWEEICQRTLNES